MIRKIVNIDEKKCNGCGVCVSACHEGAIALLEGKARLIKDDYCDGLGDCLPACPVDAIEIIEREANDYNETEVKERLKNKKIHSNELVRFVKKTCPGTQARMILNRIDSKPIFDITNTDVSMLSQWPVKIKLVPTYAEYFDNANLLIAADCSAYAYANFHNKFIRNHITIIGCPKLDNFDYSDKLSEIIKKNEIRSLMVIRMEVPCCGGLTEYVKKSLKKSGKVIPLQVITISCDGKILES